MPAVMIAFTNQSPEATMMNTNQVMRPTRRLVTHIIDQHVADADPGMGEHQGHAEHQRHGDQRMRHPGHQFGMVGRGVEDEFEQQIAREKGQIDGRGALQQPGHESGCLTTHAFSLPAGTTG
jgi:hypothetical protein